jgi:hypothetical protein
MHAACAARRSGEHRLCTISAGSGICSGHLGPCGLGYVYSTHTHSQSHNDDDHKNIYIHQLNYCRMAGELDDEALSLSSARDRWASDTRYRRYGKLAERDISRRGKLAIHLACEEYQIPTDVLRLIIVCFPQGLRIRDTGCRGWGKRGRLPIHALLAGNPKVATGIVQLMISLYLESLKEPNGNGRLPLHIAHRMWI